MFHAPWERRALALTLAMGATASWNIDMSRAARETVPGYADRSYYDIWITALQSLLMQRDMLHADELLAQRSTRPAPPVQRVLRAADVAGALAAGTPTQRNATVPAAFAVGQTVRTRAHAVPHHSRLPAYAMGRCGVIERIHGMHVWADTHAQGLGEQPQWLYSVAFDAQALWGSEARPDVRVSIDAWQPYLEPA